MENQAEDWGKWERIKAERNKAAIEAEKMQEDKSNLAYMDARNFSVKKGLSSRPEAFLNGGEKMANIGIVLGVLGMIGEKLLLYAAQTIGMSNQEHFMAENDAALQAIGYVRSSFGFLSSIAPLFAIAAITSSIWYYYKTRKKSWHIIITALITIGIFFLNQWLTTIIVNLFQSK